MGLGDMITIGEFCFCEEHGSEHCSKCFCDYRMVNNIQIEDLLQREFPRKTEEELLDRPPITTAFSLFLRTNRKDAEGEPIFECKLHKDAECNRGCMDWGQIVVTRMKGLAKSKNPGAVELCREDKIGMLVSMGVEMSPSTRLSDSVIDKRLHTAINVSQSIFHVPEGPFDPVKLGLSTWKSASTDPGTVYGAVRRSDLNESWAAMERGQDTAFPLYQNAFMDVRQTLMTLANNWDNGKAFAVLQDKADEHVVFLRIIDIYRLQPNLDIPIILVTYSHMSRATPSMQTLEWVSDMMRLDAESPGPRGLPKITATLQEQMLFLTILDLNAKRLASSYKPERRLTEKEGMFRFSFLLPIGPLGFEDLGRLTKTEGCTICGKLKTSRCAGCLTVEYCGAECQRLHWNEHKLLCKTLRGAVFSPIKLAPEPEEMRIAEAMDMSDRTEVRSGILLNWIDTTEDTWSRLKDKKSTTMKKSSYEIHGPSPFLVKIQRNRFRPLGEMYVSDRQKALEGFLVRGGEGSWTAEIHNKLKKDQERTGKRDPDEDNVKRAVKGLKEWVDKESWDAALQEFTKEQVESKEGRKDKIYRWAKWVPKQAGGNEQACLHVCWDRRQNRDPVW